MIAILENKSPQDLDIIPSDHIETDKDETNTEN